MAPVIILIVLAAIILFILFYKKPLKSITLPEDYREMLLENVTFYTRLNEKEKKVFEQKVMDFLGYITIEGVSTEVAAIDRLLIASSAIIPVFYLSSYKYFNLRSVLLYPGTFNKESFLEGGYERNTLGMVGTGPMQGSMILSKAALRSGFIERDQPGNTGIHEFVHLLDKEDGGIDGLPESLLQKEYQADWLKLVNENMQKILEGKSDINSYATTNRAEFLCVVSEYFFNLPEKFKEMHPELNKLLRKMYQFPGAG